MPELDELPEEEKPFENPEPTEWDLERDGDPFEVLQIAPDGSPTFVVAVGRKGSGKSHFIRSYARSWPYDGLIVDPTRDFDPHGEFTLPWPGGSSWPEPDPDDPYSPRLFRVVPDRINNPQHREDVDKIIHLAHENPEPTMIGVDEGRYLFGSDKPIPPATDVVLNEGRHGEDFLFVANPRAIGIRPILWAQADLIAVFDLPNEADVDAIAGPIGMRTSELAGLIRNLEKKDLPPPAKERPSGFVLIDARQHAAYVFPPLP